jgi:succinate dehydrogenase hydrophobic anchor subunit
MSVLTSENSRGFTHWIFQRISALSFFSLLVLVYFTDNVVFGCFGLFVITIHINSGLETLVVDYMHDYKARIYTEAALDILTICLVKSVFLFFLYI